MFAMAVVGYLLSAVETFSLYASREVAINRYLGLRSVKRIFGIRCSFSILLYIIAVTFAVALGTLKLLLIIVGLRIIIRGFTLDWAFQGFERMSLVAFGLLLEGGGFLGVLIFFKSSLSCILVAKILIFTQSASAFVVFVTFVLFFGIVLPTFEGRYTISFIKGLLPLIGGNFLLGFWVQGPILFLKFFASGADVANYAVAQQLALPVSFLIVTIPPIFVPRIAYLSKGKMGQEKIHEIICLLFRAGLLVILPVVAMLSYFSDMIFELFYGGEYTEGVLMFSIMIWHAALMAIASVYSSMFIAQNHEGIIFIDQMIIGIVNVSCLLVMVPLLGPWAASMSCVLGEVASLVYFRHKAKQVFSERLLPLDAVSWKYWLALAIAGVAAIYPGIRGGVLLRLAPGVVYLVLLMMLREVRFEELRHIRNILRERLPIQS